MAKRVLVVDDYPPMVKLIEKALMEEGFSVVPAEDGTECLAKASEYRPDLVILDVNMPRMDGLHALRVLRSRPETRCLPVIMLTVRREHGDALDGWMAGADSYLAKPCKIEELIAEVKRLLGEDGHKGAEPSDGVSPDPEPPS
jgi:two-component system response regulator MprA